MKISESLGNTMKISESLAVMRSAWGGGELRQLFVDQDLELVGRGGGGGGNRVVASRAILSAVR